MQTGLNQREGFIERMKALGIGICVIFIAVITGPFAIGLAWLFQWWCASCRIDSRDRWDNIRVFAWLLGIPAGLFYFADIIFHAQVVHYWVRSPLHVLGSPVGDNFVFLWIVGLIWSPALTFLIEEGRPRTIRRFLRVKTDDEKQAEKRREKERLVRERAAQQRAAEVERRKSKEKSTEDLQATTQGQAKTAPSAPTQASDQQKPKDQRSIEEQRRDEWLKEQAAHRARQTPPLVAQPQPTVEWPSPTPKKKEKPDWGDGDMSSLL